MEGRQVVTEVDAEGCPSAPEAARRNLSTNVGLLFGQEFRSPQDYGNRANQKNSNTSCLHIRRKWYGQNSRICSLFLKELMKNLWRNVPWKRWPLPSQVSRRSCTPIISRRIRSRTRTIFLKLNHTGRSSNNTNFQRKPKKNPNRPRRMQQIRSTATTLGLLGTRSQSKKAEDGAGPCG